MNTVKIRHRLSKTLNAFSCAFSKIQKKVVFESFYGNLFCDNPRAVCEKMHELYPEYQLVWGVREIGKGTFPDYVKVCELSSMQYRRERATAIAYIRNEAMTEDLYKRKNQVFIQTWHGDRGFKKILYDSWVNTKRPDEVMDNALTDLFVVGSDYAEKRIQTAFRYHGKVMKKGSPRNDCLVYPKDVETVRNKLNIAEGKKILLYAPTLKRGKKVLDVNVDLKETLRQLGEDWVGLVRAHPKSLGLDLHGSDKLTDVSAYPDMSDLLMIADLLITDYSSSAGDFILRRKPVILAQFDKEEYENSIRELYVSCEEIGYFIAGNQEELNTLIHTMTAQKAEENCDKIMNYYGVQETGHSAEEICLWINEQYMRIR